MRQPQRNLFFAYRGTSADPSLSDLVLEKQLEDNATKALIYVLEHADRKAVLAPFLRDIVGLKHKLSLDDVQFALQRVDIARPEVRQRVALSIAPVAGLREGRTGPQQGGRPDAWIWTDGSFSVLLETKTAGAATADQIKRHIHGATGWTPTNCERRARSWDDVYTLFRDIRRSRAILDPTTRLLLDEFVRYVRMLNLASDTVFDLEDFGYFLLDPKDRDSTTRALLQRKLMRFTKDLTQAPAMRSVMRQYGHAATPEDFVSPGTFRKDAYEYWITVGPKSKRKQCHFTVRITEEGIDLEAFSPVKGFTSRFLRKIEAEPKSFIRCLQAFKIEAPYRFRLREAYYYDPTSSYKGQRISKRIDYLNVHPAFLTEKNLRQLIIEPMQARLSKRDFRPEIFFVRHFALSELVGKPKVVDLVANAATPMLPYFDFALSV